MTSFTRATIAGACLLSAVAHAQAQSTRATMNSYNNQYIVSNSKGAISGPIANGMFNEIINSSALLNDTNTFTGLNTFILNPTLSACIGIPVSTGSAPFTCSSTLPAALFPGLTGDVTTPANSFVTTIGNGVVTSAKMAAGAAGANIGVISASAYGVVCDGVINSATGTDNTNALNNALAALTPEKTLLLPEGVCNFSANLHFGVGTTTDHITVKGAGLYSTTLQYTGANTTIDLFSIGSGTVNDPNSINASEFSNFRITSITKMTAGFALHAWHVTRAVLNVVIDGQDGSGNLYGGLWLDENDVVSLPWNDIKAQADNLRVNGSRQSEPWWPNYVGEAHLGHGKIGGYGAGGLTTTTNSVGIHMAGGVGYLTCDDADIIGNKFNLLVDTAVTATGNQSINTGQCAFDTPENSGASIYINDASSPTQWQGGTKQIEIKTWAAGAPGLPAVVVHAWGGGYVQIEGAIGGGTNGVTVDDATAEILVSSSAKIYNNTSYGIYSSVANPKISIASANFTNNTSGDLSPNVFKSSLPIYYNGGSCTVGLAIGGSATGITYSNQQCGWQMSGYDVLVNYTLALTSKGSNTGVLTLTGLPVTVSATLSGGGGSVNYYTNWSSLTGALGTQAGSTTTTVNVYQTGATGLATVSDTNLTDTATMYGNIIYAR